MPRQARQQDQRAARAARLPASYDDLFDTVTVRTAYRCRAYPGEQQQQVLNRTFGCVRVAWNRTLADRHARWQADRKSTSYAQADTALTFLKKDPDLAFLTEVSSVPLQQALRRQHQAFTAFFARRARYPRFKSRRGRQAAHDTRRAFTLRGGQLRLAKTAGPLRFTWSWPGQGHGEGGPRPPQGPRCPAGLPAPRQHPPGPRERRHRDRGTERRPHVSPRKRERRRPTFPGTWSSMLVEVASMVRRLPGAICTKAT